MTDKMREEFELAVLKGELLPCSSVSRSGDDGEYSSVLTTVAWVSWQASRAALCVELPSRISDDSDKWSVGYDFGVDAAADSLDSVGVHYKWQA